MSLLASPAAEAEGWRLCVAPMMDWTDRHCRWFHRLLSPHARLYTEMVVAQAAIHGDRERLLGFDPAEHAVALQLGGCDPALLARAARIGADFGYDEINLNVGCPSDRVQSGRFGACLMREPALVADAVAAMRAAVGPALPVTVKCRLGVDDEDRFETLLHFIDTVAGAGCGVFIVHARNAWLQGLSPRENREVPPLRPHWVHRIKALRPTLTVVLNGGLQQVADCREHLRMLDGVMLGRAAYHTPWVLAELEQALYATPLPARTTVISRLCDYIDGHVQRGGAPHHVLRHVLGLFQGQPGARRFRQQLTGVRDWNRGAVLRAAAAEVGVAGVEVA